MVTRLLLWKYCSLQFIESLLLYGMGWVELTGLIFVYFMRHCHDIQSIEYKLGWVICPRPEHFRRHCCIVTCVDSAPVPLSMPSDVALLSSVESFLDMACSVAVIGGSTNKEYALHILHKCKGNIKVCEDILRVYCQCLAEPNRNFYRLNLQGAFPNLCWFRRLIIKYFVKENIWYYTKHCFDCWFAHFSVTQLYWQTPFFSSSAGGCEITAQQEICSGTNWPSIWLPLWRCVKFCAGHLPFQHEPLQFQRW